MKIPVPSWPRRPRARALAVAAMLLTGAAGHAQTTTYCATGLGGVCGGNDITALSISGTTLNATGLTCAATGGQAYATYPATGATTATLSGGVPYTLSTTLTGASIVSVWIDYNRNFVFEASEWTQVATSSPANTPATASILVPANAVQGQTALRIRSRSTGSPNGSGDACTPFFSGETKDFTVTIGAPAACPAVTGLAVTGITATGASVSFTPASAATTYTVTVTPAGGTATTQTATGSPVALTGLTASTAYTVSIVGNCGASGTSAANAISFATGCTTAPYSLVNNTTPYSQDFEAAWLSQCATNDVPGANWRNTPLTGNNSWRREDDGASAAWTGPTSGAYTPAGSPLGGGTSLHSARFHTYNATSRSFGLLDLYVNMAGTTGTPTLNFDYINTTGSDSLKVYVSTNGGTSFTATPVASFVTASTWTRQTVNLPATGLTATTIVRLRASSDFGTTDIGVDNVRVSYITCPAVTGAAISGITATGATLAFTPASGSTNYTVTVTPTGGTATTQTATGSPVALTGLTPSTTYTVTIVGNCGASGTSAVTTLTFSTGCVAAPYVLVNNTTPYAQDFEAAWLSQCATNDVPSANWRNTPLTGNTSWRREDDGASAAWTGPTLGAFTPAGSPLGATSLHAARFHSYNVSGRGVGTLDLYANMAGTTGTPTLSFDYINTSGTDSVKVLVSTNGGSTFSTVALGGFGISSTWTRKTVNLPTGLTATTIVRLRAVGDFGVTDIGVDNVLVSYITCPAVTGAAISGITATGATLTFTPASAATNYTVTVTPTGGPATTVTPAPTGSPVALTGLTASTAYTVTIVGNCGASGTSAVTTLTFSTGCVAAPYVLVNNTTPYAQDFEAAWLSQCGTNDVPSANWRNTPLTGNTSWRREDDGASAAWTGPTSGAFTPAGSPLGATSLHAARFHSYNVSGRGVGTLDLYANMAGTTGTPTLSFDYINTSGTDSVKVLISTNGGSTFSASLGGFGVSSTWSRKTVNLPATGLTATTIVRLRAVGDFGTTDIGVDNVLLSYVSCPAVSGLTATGISTTGATINFTTGPASTTYTLTITPAGGTATTQTATTSPVTLTSLTPGTAYTVSIVSSCGPGQTSQPSVLTFNTLAVAPANDDCAGAINIPVQFGTCVGQTSADNTAATASTGAPAPACASYSGGDVWFKVTVPVSGTITVQTVPPTAGSPITDTGMTIYSGSCATLTDIGCDDDSSPNGLFSLLTLTGRTPGEVLYVRVWAYNNSNQGLLAVCATTPSNCAAPTGPTATNVTNTTATLSWQAPSPAPTGATYELEYGVQGFTQGTGTAVIGLTNPTYALTNLQANTTYCFYVRTNCGTTNGSSSYVGPICFTTPLTVPNNDEPCGAITLGTTTLTGSNVGSTTSFQNGIPLPTCSSAQQPKDVWYAFTATATSMTFNMTGTAAGLVRVFSSPSCSAGPFTQVACQASAGSNQSVGRVVVPGLTTGTRYYLAVSGYGSADTPGSFTVLGTVTGTRAQAETDALVVYPNPSNTGQLTLRLGALTGAGQATLLNALGQVVATKNLTGTAEQTMSTRGLATGLYTLRVTIAGQVLTRKVVLE
jgi:hypothetical protein